MIIGRTGTTPMAGRDCAGRVEVAVPPTSARTPPVEHALESLPESVQHHLEFNFHFKFILS